MVNLRLLTKQDLPFLLEIRNDSSTRINLENDSIFSLKQCENWFSNLKSPWYIIEYKNTPVGYFRVDNEFIGVDIHMDHRKKGYAKQAFKEYLKNKEYAALWVFEDNFAKDLYLKLGFIETGESKIIRNRNYIKMEFKNMNQIKLNLGCASKLLEGYVNIDQDDIDTIRARYPWIEFPKDAYVYTYDVFNLPYEDGTVDEVIADGFIEHLSFIEEKLMFEEIKRVLKPGGMLSFAVPNFEKVVRLWLEAEDNWQDFYRLDEEAIEQKHWFGTYTYEPNNRWGYLTAQLYGSQHGEGQFHQNCYTIPKIKAMLTKLGFSNIDVTEFQWKGDRDPMLRTVAVK